MKMKSSQILQYIKFKPTKTVLKIAVLKNLYFRMLKFGMFIPLVLILRGFRSFLSTIW